MLSRKAVLAALVLAVAAVAPLLGTGSTIATASQPGVYRIGRLDMTSPCYTKSATGTDRALGAVIVLEYRNQQAGSCADAPLLVFRAFSTSSLKLLSERVPTMPPALASRGLDPRQLTMDEANHRLFIYFISETPGSPNDIISFSTSDVVHGSGAIVPLADIQMASATVQAGTSSPTGLVPTRNPTGPAGDYVIVPTGMTYDAVGDDLYLVLAQSSSSYPGVTSAHGSGSFDVYTARIHVKDGSLAWLLPLDQCTYSPKMTSAASVFLADDPIALVTRGGKTAVYTGCIFTRSPSVFDSNQLFSGLSLSGSMLSYVVPLDSSRNPVGGGATYAIGRPGVLGGIADADSGRIFWPASPPSQQGETSGSGPAAVVFDGVHGVYVGAPTVGGPGDINGGFLMAVGGGRFYSFSRAGITVGDANATPPGQGVLVPGFSCPVVSVALDSPNRRLFAREVSNCADQNTDAKPYIDVFQDGLPSVSPPAPVDPDSYTKQLNEAPGVTSSQFNAHAEASGSRIRLVGGPGGFASGATFSGYDIVFSKQLGLPAASPLDNTSRELALGVVHASNLDNYQASSNAIASSADDATANQLTNNQLVAQWPFKEVHCSDPGSKQAGVDDTSDTSATVSCDDAGRTTSAASAAGPAGLGLKLTGQAAAQSLPVTIAQSVTTTHVWLDAAAGVISESHAIARGINLGIVGIGEVESNMRCSAHGRTRTATCAYTRLISGAASGGVPIGGGACLETDTPAGTVGSCTTLLGALNALQPGQITFMMPEPDRSPNTLAGSPGGYQSIGKRELYEHLQDDVVNYDSSNQVPGLEVTYVNDSSYQPSRLNVQLAGTEAEAHYGIQPASATDFASIDTGAVNDFIPTARAIAPNLPLAIPGETGPGAIWHTITKAVQKVFAGIAVLLRSPLTGLVVAALLLIMASPLGIAWRRRCLLIALNGG